MRILIFLLGLVMMVVSGCSINTCHAFPKLEWYWSSDAIECRREKAAEKKASQDWQKDLGLALKQQSTNKP